MKLHNIQCLVLPALAAVVLTALCGCGGQPEHYDEETGASVFVWNQNAWAEHPGVAEKGDPGTPVSSHRRLIGKTMTLTWGENSIVINFNSVLHCNVTTAIPNAAWGNYHSTAAMNKYEYTLTDEKEGKKASLTVNYLNQDGFLGKVKVDMTFTDVFHADASIQEVRLMGDLAGEGLNYVVPGTLGTVNWVVLP